MKNANSPYSVRAVSEARDVEAVRFLIREYLLFLDEDLTYQNIETELAGLPGKYAPPDGALFLATLEGPDGNLEPAGCAALRKIGDGVCEMKRLFVPSRHRGAGLGRSLAERVIREARLLGYRTMRLDTLERLNEAVGLYRSLGFRAIDPYCENPLPGAMFWEKDL